MKICFITDISTRDVFGLDFSNYYAKDNDVSVVTFSSYNPESVDKSIQVYHMDINRLSFFRVLKQVKKLLRHTIQPDVVISMNCGYHAGISSLLGFHPFIWFSYGSDVSYNMYISKYKSFIIKYIISKADMILAQDVVMGNRIKNIVGKNKKIVVKHWGVDTGFFNYRNNGKTYDVVNLHGYSQYYYRYVDIYLKAVSLLKNKGLLFKPVLVGNNGFYDNLIQSLDIQDILVQKEYLTPLDYKTILYDSKLLVDPMYPEFNDGCGFGIATIEAMSCGTPVLLADRECAMLNGKNKWFYGFIFKHCDIQSLADNIQFLLDDKILRNNISIMDRGSVEKNFDKNINREVILDEIKKTCR